MIYTTYFDNIKNLPADVIPISISADPPYGYKRLSYKALAPNSITLAKFKHAGHGSREDALCRYDKFETDYCDRTLSQLSVSEVFEQLHALAGVEPGVGHIALVCGNRLTDFSHRPFVRKWFNDNGVLCEEF